MFKNFSEDALKHLFYKSKFCMYDYDQGPFEMSDTCKEIIIIVSGVMEIELNDFQGEH